MLACIVGDESALEFLLKNGAVPSLVKPVIHCHVTLRDDCSVQIEETALKLAFANERIQIAERVISETNGDELDERRGLRYDCVIN